MPYLLGVFILLKCEAQLKTSCCYGNFFTSNSLTTTICHNAMTIINTFRFTETTIPICYLVYQLEDFYRRLI